MHWHTFIRKEANIMTTN